MKKNTWNVNVIFPACTFLLSVVYLFLGRKFNLGTLKRPGVGFLPMISGSILLIFSLFQTIKEMRSQAEAKKLEIRWPKIVIFFALVSVYALLLKPLGYTIATFFLLFLCAKLYGARSWIKPVIFGFLFALISYYLFVVLLHVQLP